MTKEITTECKGCNKIIGDITTKTQTCSTYAIPASRHRMCRCPAHSIPVTTDKKDKKVNPLKASKRKGG